MEGIYFNKFFCLDCFFLFDKRAWKIITSYLFLFAGMDFQILSFINNFWHGTRLDTFSRYISRDRSMIIIRTLIIIIAVLLKKRYRKFVVFAFVLAAGLSYSISDIGFKTALIHETGIRTRPYIAHSVSIKPIGKLYADSSFPSTHVWLTVAMITVLIILFPAVRPYAILYALLMAWSRMFNGMHYPSDVVVGTILGILCGWIAVVMSKRVF